MEYPSDRESLQFALKKSMQERKLGVKKKSEREE